MLIIKKSQSFDGHLVDSIWKATDPSPSRQFIKAAHPIFLAGKLNEDGLHGGTSNRSIFLSPLCYLVLKLQRAVLVP